MSSSKNEPEFWLRGPVAGIPFLLQPVAHALLQAKEDVRSIAKDIPQQLLWQKPAGCASAGFHLKHLTGVLNRLFTYARGEMLNAEQLAWLAGEEYAIEHVDTPEKLVLRFEEQVTTALNQLADITDKELYEKREVGRAKLPSNSFGLLFHAAEHTQRHVGQLLVTVRILTHPH
jgi:hypothetical protein